jgi:PAS domain S-box-containing protein
VLGYEPGKFSKYEHFAALLHPLDFEPAMNAMRNHLDGKTKTYDISYRMRKTDGKYMWFRDVGRVTDRTTEGKPLKVKGMVMEIDRMKRAEETLRSNEAKYRLLFENMGQGVFYQEPDGTFSDCNLAALEMFGLTKDEFFGRTSAHPEWHIVDEKRIPLTLTQYPSMQALLTGREVNRIVGVYNPVTKGFKWLSVIAKPQFLQGQPKPYRVFVTMHDITDRKLAEDSLRLIYEENRAIIDANPDLVFRIQSNGIILACHAPDPSMLLHL